MTSHAEEGDRQATPARPRGRGRSRSLTDVRGNRRRWLTWFVGCVAFALMVNALVGDNGYLSTIRARREQAELEHAVRKLRLENRELQLESRRIREDASALEDAARRTLGLLRPGETLVIVRDARPANARPQE